MPLAAVFEAAAAEADAEADAATAAELPLPIAVNFSLPAVTKISIVPTASYVVVLEPGKFASLPPAVSLHSALLTATIQSTVAVKSVLGSDMSMLYVEGPKTRISWGKRPQSSVLALQASARVVAVGLAATTEAATVMAVSTPMKGAVRVVCCAVARLRREVRRSVEIIVSFVMECR